MIPLYVCTYTLHYFYQYNNYKIFIKGKIRKFKKIVLRKFSAHIAYLSRVAVSGLTIYMQQTCQVSGQLILKILNIHLVFSVVQLHQISLHWIIFRLRCLFGFHFSLKQRFHPLIQVFVRTKLIYLNLFKKIFGHIKSLAYLLHDFSFLVVTSYLRLLVDHESPHTYGVILMQKPPITCTSHVTTIVGGSSIYAAYIWFSVQFNYTKPKLCRIVFRFRCLFGFRFSPKQRPDLLKKVLIGTKLISLNLFKKILQTHKNPYLFVALFLLYCNNFKFKIFRLT